MTFNPSAPAPHTGTALALLSGALLALSFPKFGHPAFAWIALSPLVVAAALAARTNVGPLRVFRLGVLTGLAYFGGALYWVVGVMTTYGGLPVVVAVLVAALLSGYLALYVGAVAVLTGMAVRRAGIAGVWLVPLFWVAAEWLRATLFGGFPWALLGSSQAPEIPVAQLASITGVFGLSALVALVSAAAAAVALSRKGPHLLGAGAAVALVGLIAAGGTIRVARGQLVRTGDVVRVGLLQGNIEQDIKWDPAHRVPILQQYIDLSRRVIGAGAALVIWPEASTPFFFDRDAVLAEPIRRLAVESRTPFLIGTDEVESSPDGDRDARVYNAAVLVGPDGRTRASYRKMSLVPFGEYVPLKRLLFFVGPLVEAVSDFSAGVEPVVFDAAGRRVSVSICYESVYPSISRAFVLRGSQLLATITNDAWFGRSSAAYQHFDQGALRAIEEGRYVVRAANTGISGAVDPYGRVIARTRLFEPAAITVDVRLLTDRTIYSRTGDLVAWIALAATALFIVLTGRSIRG
jgi:apolipoprotein N-acyltransferase